MDVTPTDRHGTQAYIRKTCTMEQKKENATRKEGEERNPNLLE
jgi:hypothetical protein